MYEENITGPVRAFLDPETNEVVNQPMEGAERKRYYYGENVGMLVFRQWYPCISMVGIMRTCKPTISRFE